MEVPEGTSRETLIGNLREIFKTKTSGKSQKERRDSSRSINLEAIPSNPKKKIVGTLETSKFPEELSRISEKPSEKSQKELCVKTGQSSPKNNIRKIFARIRGRAQLTLDLEKTVQKSSEKLLQKFN